MDPRLSSLERAITSDESIAAFQTLVLLKKEVIAALHYEYEYAQRECEAIAAFNNLYSVVDNEGNISRNSSARSVESSTCNCAHSHDDKGMGAPQKDHKLIRWQSPECQKLEMRWRSQLNRSVECINAQLTRERQHTVTLDEMEAIYDSISQLQNTYFQVVEERENNNKLWLRLKMYTATRKDALEKACKPYESVRNIPNEVKRETVDEREPPDLQLVKDRWAQGRGRNKDIYGHKDLATASDYSTHVQHSMQESTDRSDQSVANLMTKYANTASIDEFINQMKSTTQFYTMTRNLYIQYGDGSMSYRVFNNIVEFLLRSLGVHSVDLAAVKRVMKVYEITPASKVDFNTFVMMYWEIAHIIRNSLDPTTWVDIVGIHRQTQAMWAQEENTYVYIEDILIFKKKLTSGDYCTKYLAVDIDTGELRVVDIITKSPQTPKFQHIAMEIARVSKLQNRHLARYLVAYHDLSSIYVVSEYCEYGSLLNHIQIKRGTIYTMGFIHMVMSQVIEAILYIHCNNMVHGSLSIDKVMIPDTEYNQIKIRDLGMRGLLDTEVQGSALTWMHMAPEGGEGRLSHKSDIWSAGVILAWLVTGIMPDERMEYSEYRRAVENTLASGRMFPRDDDLTDIVRKMINPDINARPTAFEIISHPWCTKPMHLDETPGAFRQIVQPINRLMRQKRLHIDLLRVVEAQEVLCISHIRKLKDTIELIKKLRGDRLLVKDFKHMLEAEGLGAQIINNMLAVVAFDEEEIRTADFVNTLSRWKNAEIALTWNKFKKQSPNLNFSAGKAEFADFLSNAHSRLIPTADIYKVCDLIAVEQEIYWIDFVRCLDET